MRRIGAIICVPLLVVLILLAILATSASAEDRVPVAVFQKGTDLPVTVYPNRDEENVCAYFLNGAVSETVVITSYNASFAFTGDSFTVFTDTVDGSIVYGIPHDADDATIYSDVAGVYRFAGQYYSGCIAKASDVDAVVTLVNPNGRQIYEILPIVFYDIRYDLVVVTLEVSGELSSGQSMSIKVTVVNSTTVTTN